MLKFLPLKYQSLINKIDQNALCEIRIRINYPVVYKFYNNTYQLKNENDNIIATENDIKTIIDNLTEKSIYAYNEFIKNGYILIFKYLPFIGTYIYDMLLHSRKCC